MPSQNGYSCVCQRGLHLISAPLRLRLSVHNAVCAISNSSIPLTHACNHYFYFLSEMFLRMLSPYCMAAAQQVSLTLNFLKTKLVSFEFSLGSSQTGLMDYMVYI